jgi:tetratricopeptide (TPR) repeat protein
MKKLFHFAVGCLGLSVAFMSFAAEAPARAGAGKAVKQMAQAQALVQVGKFKEAYELLQPLEFEQAGDVQYDYLLGVSAVNAGKPDRATIALERIMATNPGLLDARQWLAIAYFQSGDMTRAKNDFNWLLSQALSTPQIKATATQYLTAIKQQEDAREAEARKAQRPYLLGNVEFGYGKDSSIASVPQDYSSAYLASIGQPAPADQPKIPSGIADRFELANLNMEGRVPFLNAGTYGYLSVDSNHRAYHGHGMMNSHTSIVKGGLNFVSRGHTYRVEASRRGYRQVGTEVSRGYTNNSAQSTVLADARLMLSEHDFWAFSAQYSSPHYPTTPTQDTKQTVFGTNYMHIFARQGSPLVYFAFNHTRDKAIRSMDQYRFDGTYDLVDPNTGTVYGTANQYTPVITDVSRKTNALIAYMQYTFIESADITAMWMESRRADSTEYARSGMLDFARGKDMMHVAMLGMNWRPAKDWVVHPQWMRTKNDSNIPLYSYQKSEVSVSVKREFK